MIATVKDCDCTEMIEARVKDLEHFMNESDWQYMKGGELVDVHPSQWLRATLQEARKDVVFEIIQLIQSEVDEWKLNEQGYQTSDAIKALRYLAVRIADKYLSAPDNKV